MDRVLSDEGVAVLPRDLVAGHSRAAHGGDSIPCSVLLQALPAAVYTTDALGRITFYNEAAAVLWGHRPELGKSEWCGSWRLYWPDGTPMPHNQCPMARALKERRPIRGVEALAERPDGTRVPFRAYPTPLWDESGTLIGALNMLVDVSDREKAEHSAQLLAAIVDSSDDAILSKDLNGIITTSNRGAERLFGYKSEELVGKPVMILIPPDRHTEEAEILAKLRRGERVEHYDTIRQRKDGSLVEISLSVSPITDSKGKVVGASKIARDITERRQAEERQRLLIKEMNHRVKNLFALAGGLVTLSARSAATPKALAESVRERLAALARAHDLTLPGVLEATTLPLLLRTIVSPYVTPGHVGVTLDGPEVSVGGNAVMSIALLLHEIATNAAKYGALSSQGGRVDVRWLLSGDELLLDWRERGGAVLHGEPQFEGFGSLLARLIVTGQLGGKIIRDWEEEGLTVHLSVPRERLAP
ncbi:MAG TPA: PAS domain S-box protein [Methylocella sp.]|nr:PAS domain S-box protein [Methylocella sp.]